MDIKEITSRQNATVMWASSLSEKKYREKHQAFLAEGWKLVEEALASRLPVTHIFIASGKKDEILAKLSLDDLSAWENPPDVFLLSDACFEKISTEKAPQGVIAAIKYLDFFKRIDKIKGEDVSSRALALSSVRDPGNLGAIIRSAVAFGTKTVLLSSDSADVYHPRVLRAAMGSIFKISVLILENEVDAMKRSLSANHFARLAEGKCTMEVSAYFFSTIAGLERVADHLINVGYSVLNPTGSQSEARAAGEIPAGV